MSWTSDNDNEPRKNDQARDPYAAPEPEQPGQQQSPPGHQPPSQEPQDPNRLPPAYTQPPAWSEVPGGVAGEQTPYGQAPYGEPAPSEPPKSILNAVKLMYVGAGLAVLQLINVFIGRDNIRESALDSPGMGDFTASERESMGDAAVTFAIVYGVIQILLWLWMARANKGGKKWARVTATVLGGLYIATTVFSLGFGGGGLGLVFTLATIALAAYILWLLYRPESTVYYQASSRRL